ncbi:MAG TPA: hypothetical protein VE616_08060 [Candidatus Udaeobacter sp.]|jgi:hypothetical protein|nr:hypothetical protein [Candidatus Udaeobacter sp.]
MSSQNIVVRRFKKQGVDDKINKERNPMKGIFRDFTAVALTLALVVLVLG